MRAAPDVAYGDKESDAEQPSRAEALKMGSEGKSLWSKVDREKNKNKRVKTIDTLKDFTDKTGISTLKHQKQLEKHGNDPGFLNKKIEKMRAGGANHYEKLLKKSGAFRAFGKFGDRLSEEMKQLKAYFSDLSLEQMVDVLTDFDDMIAAKKKFMDRYNKQSNLVKKAFNNMVDALPLIGSKEKLLDQTLEIYGNLEDQPSAVQKEFKDRSKGITDAKKIAKIRKEVVKDYEKMERGYYSKLEENKEVFGGDEVKGADGKKRSQTHEEFRADFRNQSNFARLKVYIAALPKYINERKKLYKKRDKLLEKASSADRRKFEKITKRMRRHELAAYLKESLEPAIRNDGLMAAEFEGIIQTARVKTVSLYSPFERAQKVQQFKLASLKEQRILIAAEQIDLKRRKKTAQVYLGLPDYLRDDQRFHEAHSYDRDQMLGNALKEQAKENGPDPFDFEDDELLSTVQQREVAKGLKKEKGEKLMRNALKKLENDKAKKVLDKQMMTWNRIRKNVKIAEFKDQTQAERFDDDLARWTRKPVELKSVAQTNDERMKTKIKFHGVAKNLYDQGVVTYSGGEMTERQDISETDLMEGNDSILEKHKRARYATDIKITDTEGKDPMRVSQLMQRVMQRTITKFMPKIMEEVAREMGMSQMSALAFTNTDEAANNVEHFVAGELAAPDLLEDNNRIAA